MSPTDAGTEARPVATSVFGTRHFVRHQEPPAEWVRRLREISPVSELHSWLAFRWVADYQRWVIYECLPEAFVWEAYLAELRGPDPDLPGTVNAFPISHYQWQMYREHKVHARPAWVLQGSHGGHVASFTKEQAILCRLANEHRPEGVVGAFPDRPPAPGDLDPCAFDERTVAQLLRMNKLAAHGNDLAAYRKAHAGAAGVKRQRSEAEKQMRRQMLAWLNDQLEEPLEYFKAADAEGALDGAERTADDFTAKDELADHMFVEEGRVI